MKQTFDLILIIFGFVIVITVVLIIGAVIAIFSVVVILSLDLYSAVQRWCRK